MSISKSIDKLAKSVKSSKDYEGYLKNYISRIKGVPFHIGDWFSEMSYEISLTKDKNLAKRWFPEFIPSNGDELRPNLIVNDLVKVRMKIILIEEGLQYLKDEERKLCSKA